MASPAPGSLVPATPSRAALAEVRAVLEMQAAQVDQLDKQSMRALLPALIDARDELRAQLLEWLRDAPDGDERFTAQQLRRSLLMIESALDRIRALDKDMEDTLRTNARAAGVLAISNLEEQVARFGAAFGESVYPTDLNLAAALAKGDKLLVRKYRTSAARYAGSMTEDIRHQLAIGVARNETWSQMKARLVRLGGPTGMVALRGVLGEPGAVAEYIAEGLFKRHRYWAERLVRTEMVEAYNLQHQAGLELLNEARDPKVTAEYVQRWDSTLDRRVCPICKDMDRRVAKVGGKFKGGYERPPAHPQCRCLVVAWHVSWGDIAGEVPAVVDATDPLPALPRVPDKPQRPVAPKRVAKVAAPPPAQALPDPREVAAGAFLERISAGKLKPARDVLDADLMAQGMPQAQTILAPANKVRTQKRMKAAGLNNPRDGQITLRSDQAAQAQEFAKAWKADKAALQASLRTAATAVGAADRAAYMAARGAQGVHTFVHEVFHGHGPLAVHAYQGHGVFAEEMMTEWAARGYTHQRYGVPRELFDRGSKLPLGGYRGWGARLVDAVQAETGLGRAEAMAAIERAAFEFKRLPAGSLRTGDDAVDKVAELLPGDTDKYKIRLRAISRSDSRADSP